MAKTTSTATNGNEFQYDADRSRVIQLQFSAINSGAPANYTWKRVYGLGSDMEIDYTNTASSGSPVWQNTTARVYIPAPDGVVGTAEFAPTTPTTTTTSENGISLTEQDKVYHYEHLGSIQAITPAFNTSTALSSTAAGGLGLYSEDAWGMRRNPNTFSGPPTTTDTGGTAGLSPRGFTIHEMLDDLSLVHMNGRIYDPLLGRFLSADIDIQDPSDLQSYNRYSYVHNRPLSFTDPNGEDAVAAVAVTGGALLVGGVIAIDMSMTQSGRDAMVSTYRAVAQSVHDSSGDLSTRATVGTMVGLAHVMGYFNHSSGRGLQANAVSAPKAGDGGKIADTKSNMDSAKGTVSNSTNNPDNAVAAPQENLSQPPQTPQTAAQQEQGQAATAASSAASGNGANSAANGGQSTSTPSSASASSNHPSNGDDDDKDLDYKPKTREKGEDKMGGEDDDPFKGKGPKKGTPEGEKARRELEDEKHGEGRGGRDNERPKNNPYE
jgi:RHS repeat-associated protein